MASCLTTKCGILITSAKNFFFNLFDVSFFMWIQFGRENKDLQYVTAPWWDILVKMWLFMLSCRFPFPLSMNLIIFPDSSTNGFVCPTAGNEIKKKQLKTDYDKSNILKKSLKIIWKYFIECYLLEYLCTQFEFIQYSCKNNNKIYLKKNLC